jgi:hypothetical protein
MIHRQDLAANTLPHDLCNALNLAIKVVNCVKRSALNTRLFVAVCTGLVADNETLLFHLEVCWMSKGSMLN